MAYEIGSTVLYSGVGPDGKRTLWQQPVTIVGFYWQGPKYTLYVVCKHGREWFCSAVCFDRAALEDSDGEYIAPGLPAAEVPLQRQLAAEDIE